MKKLDLFVGGSGLECFFFLQSIVFIIGQYPGVYE